MELVGAVKTYDWGKLGMESPVAQLQSANDRSFEPSATTPYAELWIGSHVSGPAVCKSDGKALHEVLREPLPFLFKVLSIRKALSIQVHPNKREAERLHKERPDIYKDPNHKPELAVALSPFTALCGFRPIPEIVRFLADLPPLATLIGQSNVDSLKAEQNATNLKVCYAKLMTSTDDAVRKCITDISDCHRAVLDASNLSDVYTNISNDFPGDVGVLSVFFLNLLRLKTGQAIYLAANEIHAYLSGDCVECMACSDNVIRAGLTPKYKDVEELLSSLNYNAVESCKHIFFPYRIDECVQFFIPPVDDFAVGEITLGDAQTEHKIELPAADVILLTISGFRQLIITVNGEQKMTIVDRGNIFYIPADAERVVSFVQIVGKCEYLGYMAMKNTFRAA